MPRVRRENRLVESGCSRLTVLETLEKYCGRCAHQKYCYTPCALVNAAIWGLPCVEEIEKICGWKEEEHAGND